MKKSNPYRCQLQRLFPLLALLVALLTACQGRRYPRLLVVADSLSAMRADSADQLLRQYRAHDFADADRPTRMYYELLRLRVDDKLDVPPRGDSLALALVRYYEHEGDRRLLPRAYYYAGRIYMEQNDAPQALHYYQKALEAMKEHEDTTLTTVLNIQVAYIFEKRQLYAEATRYFMQALRYDSIHKDTSNMIYDYRDIGYLYSCGINLDSATFFLDKALSMMRMSGQTSQEKSILMCLSRVFLDKDQKEKALQTIRPTLMNASEEDRPAIYYMTATIFKNLANLDSAYCYYKKTLAERLVDINKQAISLFSLAEIAEKRNRQDEMLAYLKLYRKTQNLVDSTMAINAVAMANSAYNYSRLETESANLRVKNMQKRSAIFGLAGLLCSLSIMLVLLLLYYRKKRAFFHLRLAELKNAQKGHEEMTAKAIRQNEMRIEELNEELEEAKGELERSRLEYERELLVIRNSEVHLALSKIDLQRKRMGETEIYRRLRQRLSENKSLRTSEYDELADVVKSIYPQYSERLSCLYNLNAYELCLCNLIRIGFKPQEIAILTAHAPQSIASTRKRLYKKVLGKDGAPGDWDNFIRSL